jgi:hypothetical protein
MVTKTHRKRPDACLARAIAAELRRTYPHHAAKYVARDLDCTPKAAANLLAGHLSTTSIARVIGAYGPGWVAERVLEAAGLTLESYVEIQAAEAERAAVRARETAIAARTLRKRLETARGGDPRHGGPLS